MPYPQTKISSPDVNVFIFSLLKEKHSKEYFEKLSSGKAGKGIFLSTVQRRLTRLLQMIRPSIEFFFKYCKNTGVREDTFLEHLEKDPKVESKFIRIKKFSNLIRYMLRNNYNRSHIDIFCKEVGTCIENNINIFTKSPNEIIYTNDQDYLNRVSDEISKVCSFNDAEDLEHLALLNYWVHEMSKLSNIAFVTNDKPLHDIDISKHSKFILIKYPEEFLKDL